MNRARIFGGILMVASVAIGAGMLALPIATGYAGFWPATWMMLAAFAYMVIGLMLCLEANLTTAEGSNIISMVGQTLGPAGQGVAWTSYLLLLYSAVAAYISGGGDVVTKMVNWNHPGLLTQHAATLGLIALVVGLVFAGTRFVDYFNRLLTAGLVLSFIALLFFVLPAAEPAKLAHSQPRYVWSALPLLLLSFTSHLMVPSLRTYLHGHVRALLWVLLAGSVIPLIMYLVW